MLMTSRAPATIQFTVLLLGLSMGSPIVARTAPAPSDPEFFTASVQPLLEQHCHRCHSHDAPKIKGGLVLDSRAGLLQGGDSGPAIVAGHPERSLLITAVGYQNDDLQMPPLKGDARRLSPEEIETLSQWIQAGAVWPGSDDAAAPPTRDGFTDKDRSWWAFQPVERPDVPAVGDSDWVQNPIDAFILRKLEREELQPAPEADRATLMRRAYFDLWGLPPSPEEIEAFVRDPSTDAYRQMIDRLLDSPRYGERWARHWLDLVRYAESDGYKADDYRPTAWRYRDYVIQSLNEDKPYNRFVMEQLAGDELAPDDPGVMVATGYLRNGIYEYNQRDVVTQWDHMLYDITDTTGEVFLGLGMACARCHDHKFDPILQKDYYRLLAFFTPLLPRDDLPLATTEDWTRYQDELSRWEEATRGIRGQIDAILQPHLDEAAHAAIIKFPEEIQAALNKPAAQRTPYEQQIAALAYRQVNYEHERIDAKVKGEDKERLTALRERLAAYDELKPEALPTALVATDVGPFAPPTFIPKRQPAKDIAPGFPSILDEKPARIDSAPASPASTGRRSALARWMARDDHPLTGRVMVNRIWQRHFGRGLVATPSDFGRLGEPPSHPELLDWLATEFVDSGWSLKTMHRLIMNSAAYRQSANVRPGDMARLKDPDNRWLWRMNLRRLDGEQIRDAMLAATGELDLQSNHGSADFSEPRRSIYTQFKRNSRPDLLDAFDPPDTYASTPARNATTTPTQSLLMINGEYALRRARALAERLQDDPSLSEEERVSRAYELVFGRAPSPDESAAALAFLNGQSDRIEPAAPPSVSLAADSMPGRAGQAALFRPDQPNDRLQIALEADVPRHDFTVEAFVELKSNDTGANVRTIASQWDGNTKHPGWSLGVTGHKSKFTPQALILQLVGASDEDGEPSYEVIDSGLRIEFNRAYYVAASVQLKDTDVTGVTFYVKDMAKANEPMKTVQAAHRVTAKLDSPLAFTIGGRDNNPAHNWDGWIDDVRLSSGALPESELLLARDFPSARTSGFWRFEKETGFYQDESGRAHSLSRPTPSAAEQRTPRESAWVDFCHVLFNANEFLYVD